MRWGELTREGLAELLPEALVIVPVGATEQHGPHLPTGTDAVIASSVAKRAVELAEPTCARPLVLAPTVSYGASDHHLAFGGTLSLSPETLLAVLLDLARSLHADGGRRLFFLNGHGGNTGVCHAAAGAASARYDLAVAHADYWTLADRAVPPAELTPGHAGEFETSIMQALRPGLVQRPPGRTRQPAVAEVNGVTVHSPAIWQAIDGYTGEPAAASAERGADWLDSCATGLASRLTELAKAI